MMKTVRKFAIRSYRLQLSILAILIALWTLYAVVSPGTFLRYGIYYSIMSTLPFYAIMSLALTYVIIAGEIDLSFPDVMAFSGYVFSALFVETGNIGLAFGLCMISGLAAGVLNGVLVTKFHIPSLVATLGASFFWRGSEIVLSGGWGVILSPAQHTTFYQAMVGRLGGNGVPGRGIPAQAIWFVLLAVVLWIVLNRTKFGAHVYFVGDNLEGARMMGINVVRVKILIFTMMGACAAFAGTLENLEVLYYWPTLGSGYLLSTIASVFLGGTSYFGGMGTMLGTFMGSIIIGSLQTGIVAMGISGFWVQVAEGVVILTAVVVQSILMRRGRIRIPHISQLGRVRRRSFKKPSLK
jgi:simple sugar transport system permease protein